MISRNERSAISMQSQPVAGRATDTPSPETPPTDAGLAPATYTQLLYVLIFQLLYVNNGESSQTQTSMLSGGTSCTVLLFVCAGQQVCMKGRKVSS